MNGIGIKTQSFRRKAEPIKWNYIVQNDTEGKDSITVPENVAVDKDSIGVLVGPQLSARGCMPTPGSIRGCIKDNDFGNVGNVCDDGDDGDDGADGYGDSSRQW